jgi:polysaccharide export outer membrane protein
MKILNCKTFFFAFGAITFLLGSCAPSKNKKQFTYFENLPKDSVVITQDVHKDYQLRLQPGDVLSIKVATLNEQSNKLFNEGVLSPEGSNRYVNQTLSSEGYKIDQEGNINFPLIGKVNLKDKTVGEAQAVLAKEISKEAKNPIVNVRLLNAKVTVIGEVKNPGIVNISERKTSVLEALGAVGDIQSTGKKDNVLVIRNNQGKKEYARLNLRDLHVYESPYFYLQQDDVVVVDPTPAKERIVRGALDNREIVQLSVGVLSSAIGLLNLYFILNNSKD